MKVDFKRLSLVATPENEKGLRQAQEREEFGDLYKASTRIAMKIRRALRLSNETQLSLAEKLGVDPATVSRYLSGRANMELHTLVKLEKALNITIIDRDVAPKKQKLNVILKYYDSEDKGSVSLKTEKATKTKYNSAVRLDDNYFVRHSTPLWITHYNSFQDITLEEELEAASTDKYIKFS